MLIRYGFNIEVSLPQPTCILTLMDVRPEIAGRVVEQSSFSTSQNLPVETYTDSFGNAARRFFADAGSLSMRLEGEIKDSGELDYRPGALPSVAIRDLPPDVLPFLLPSRYCESDMLSQFAWGQFGHLAPGGDQVQAVCDFVNSTLRFSYPNALPTRTAIGALNERIGVCRDFTHLAVTLCRALNIPARYCNGYLGDIGVPADPSPMDFNAWFEAYLNGEWITYDARHNERRIGRLLIARGRDAADTAMITSFGPHVLTRFDVVTEEASARKSEQQRQYARVA